MTATILSALLCLLAVSPCAGAELAIFDLPAKESFSPAMPRYPNVWFYVDTRLAESYAEAVKLVSSNLREALHLREFYGPFRNGEGCDFEVRIEHLQPWEEPQQRSLQHSHAFHMRYYYGDLERQGLHRIDLAIDGAANSYYRFGASAHYEVEHSKPNHADVEMCPICGRTGEYAHQRGNLVEVVHDPLGLELVMTGTIRGEVVRFENWNRLKVGSVQDLANRFTLRRFVFRSERADQNTLRVGIVTIESK